MPKKKRSVHTSGKTPSSLNEALSRGHSLLQAGRLEQAAVLLEPLTRRYPRSADLQALLGELQRQRGDLPAAMLHYEQACRLGPSRVDLLHPLIGLYLLLGHNLHALRAARQIMRLDPRDLVAQGISQNMEESGQSMARTYDVDVRTVEQAVLELERGRRAISQNDFTASLAPNQRAIELIPAWPPPRNNLALALSFLGQVEEAIEQARIVLEFDPDNVQALGNMVRFHSLCGQEETARSYWERLRALPLEAEDLDDQVKAAEAAAYLEEDRAIYELLQQHVPCETGRLESSDPQQQILRLLAAAAANLGRPQEAAHCWEILARQPGLNAWARNNLEALRAGRPGPGWAPRFPYFSPAVMLSQERLDEILQFIGREARMDPKQWQQEGSELAGHYPQLQYLAEYTLWVEQQPAAAIPLLQMLGTPAAMDTLRRFGCGQDGSEVDRQQALSALAEAGGLGPDEAVPFWKDGEWHEILIRPVTVGGGTEWPYAPELFEMMQRAIFLGQEGHTKEAERLFLEILEQDPTVKEVYNNLAALYGQQREAQRGIEMLRKALELDPDYALARCNLALQFLEIGEIEEVRELLAPLAERRQFHPLEMAFLQYVQARLMIEDMEYELAERALEMALRIYPEYELASELLEWMHSIKEYPDEGARHLSAWTTENWYRYRRKVRERVPAPDASLAQAFSAHSKEVLTGTARIVLRWGGWSALRKAELIERLAENLQDPDNLDWLIREHLDEEEQEALRFVLERGGAVPRFDFAARFGAEYNDSPYWQYHEPDSIPGWLRRAGLLAEGTAEGVVYLLVPLELRESLATLLQRV